MPFEAVITGFGVLDLLLNPALALSMSMVGFSEDKLTKLKSNKYGKIKNY
jgi:hypothetical protein